MELNNVKIIFAIFNDGFAGFWHTDFDGKELKLFKKLVIDTSIVQDTRKPEESPEEKKKAQVNVLLKLQNTFNAAKMRVGFR